MRVSEDCTLVYCYFIGRMYYVYVVNVERKPEPDAPTGVKQRQWTVDRRYHEFYILESKLIEFHGESIVSLCLPPKKTFANKGTI